MKTLQITLIIVISFLFAGCFGPALPKYENQFVSAEITEKYNVEGNKIIIKFDSHNHYKTVRKKLNIDGSEANLIKKRNMFLIGIKEAALIGKKNGWKYFHIKFENKRILPIDSIDKFNQYCFNDKIDFSEGKYSPCFREYHYKEDASTNKYEIYFFKEKQIDIPTFNIEETLIELEKDEFVKKYTNVFF